MVKNFIFDVDGTLLDTERYFYESLNFALAQAGLPTVTADQKLFGMTVPATLAKLNVPDLHAVEQVWEARFNEISARAAFYDDIPETLQLLHRHGARILIVTSRGHSTVDMLWKDSAISPSIDHCVAAEDTPHHKPHPEPLLLAMAVLNLQPEQTIYIGDTAADQAAATAAGIRFAAAGWNSGAAILPGSRLSAPRELLTLANIPTAAGI